MTEVAKRGKYVVVAGYFSNSRLEFIQAIGVFQDYRAAYGEAYLYLNELSENNGKSGTVAPPARITPLMELEGGNGCAMYLVGGESDTEDFAYILFCDEKEEEEHEENSIQRTK